ncbi:FI20159p1 [Strongyloides ratti]|uniref:FI20159p1 n=1 Tax=Strongyloides ratti TaxID=34506 RepID=A0A090LDZ6_STRRB|nr:FI20159p1 [Strongyloides ratti]CEF67987.1 FI20159p1 [Strongyloides ratti]
MSKETIHSGHFMTSYVHSDNLFSDKSCGPSVEIDNELDQTENDVISTSYNSEDGGQKSVTYYKFGPNNSKSIDIDITLNKLKKCLNSAYDKMTTPKWKNFNGMKLNSKQRIRLNNIIWRSYHEFRKSQFENKKADSKKKIPIWHFAVPDDDTTHAKVEGSIVEGMYWKRKIAAVRAQYKRWRTDRKLEIKKNVGCCEKRKQKKSCGCIDYKIIPQTIRTKSLTPMSSMNGFDYDGYDDLENDISNQIYETLNSHYFEDQCGNTMRTNSDLIQPNLYGIMPSYQDFMSNDHEFFDLHNTFTYSPPTSEGNQMGSSLQTPIYGNQGEVISYNNRELPSKTTHSINAPATQYISSYMHQQPHYTQAVYGMQSVSMENQQHDFMPLSNSIFGEPLTSTTISVAAASSPHTLPPNSNFDYPQSFIHNNQVGFNRNNNNNNNLYNGGGQNYLQNNRFSNNINFNKNIDFTPSTIQQNIPQSEVWWSNNGNRGINDISQIMNPQNSSFSILQNTSPSPSFNISDIIEPPSKIENILSNVTCRNNDKTRVTRLVGSEMEGPSMVSRSGTPSKGALKAYPPMFQPSTNDSPPLNSNVKQWHDTPIESSLSRSSSNLNDKYIKDNTWLKPQASESRKRRSSLTETSFNVRTEQQNKSKKSCKMGSVKFEIYDSDDAFSSVPSTPKNNNSVVCDTTFTNHETRKRILHLNAEKNRRNALKDGFDQLLKILPNLNNGLKTTNAVVLAKSVEHINNLVEKTTDNEQEINDLNKKIEELNDKIKNFQENMPSSGKSNLALKTSSTSIAHQFERFFDRYVKEQTRKDYRFWLMWKLMRNSVTSYGQSLPSEGCQSKEKSVGHFKNWLMEHFDSTQLRRDSSNLLIYLATKTTFMSKPNSLSEYINDEIGKP